MLRVLITQYLLVCVYVCVYRIHIYIWYIFAHIQYYICVGYAIATEGSYWKQRWRADGEPVKSLICLDMMLTGQER